MRLIPNTEQTITINKERADSTARTKEAMKSSRSSKETVVWLWREGVRMVTSIHHTHPHPQPKTRALAAGYHAAYQEVTSGFETLILDGWYGGEQGQSFPPSWVEMDVPIIGVRNPWAVKRSQSNLDTCFWGCETDKRRHFLNHLTYVHVFCPAYPKNFVDLRTIDLGREYRELQMSSILHHRHYHIRKKHAARTSKWAVPPRLAPCYPHPRHFLSLIGCIILDLLVHPPPTTHRPIHQQNLRLGDAVTTGLQQSPSIKKSYHCSYRMNRLHYEGDQQGLQLLTCDIYRRPAILPSHPLMMRDNNSPLLTCENPRVTCKGEATGRLPVDSIGMIAVWHRISPSISVHLTRSTHILSTQAGHRTASLSPVSVLPGRWELIPLSRLTADTLRSFFFWEEGQPDSSIEPFRRVTK
ncbi:hypothetical protein HYFRA_00002039 [Hymenoscyphus fraxineus]|uniref:Uncharacterized protein n=1 Tax=Hymenoscyphus fraxineus TaxID=746836 RepID=A0A9N9KNV9_9HELO|nr:hypothetical protein HYFRA_00002039 [Hymenoscyphus fraxineus]